MNYRPSFCVINTVSTSFSGRSGFCMSQRLPKSKSHFKRTCQSTRSGFTWGPDSVSFKDYRNQFHISTERVSQLVQVRREHVVYGNTVLFQSKANFSKGKPKTPGRKTSFETLCDQKMFFWFFLGKRWFWREEPIFPRKKMVLYRKTSFFLGKRWFWIGKPTFSS